MKPQRGRTCQCLQPGSPMSSLRDAHPLVRRRVEQHLLDQAAVLLLRVGAVGERGAAVLDPRRRGRRAAPRARPATAGAARRGRRTPTSKPLRGQVEQNSEASSLLEARDLVEQRPARGALVGQRRAERASRRSAPGRRGTSLPAIESDQLYIRVSPAVQSASSTAIARHALHAAARTGPCARSSASRPASWRHLAEHDRHRPAPSSATTIWRADSGRAPGRAARRRATSRSPGSPSTRSASSAITGTPVSAIAIVSASSSRFSLRRPPCSQPLERDPLHRRAVGVGVDADLAGEDPVGPRHGVLAHVDHLAAGVAVGQRAQPLLHVAAGSCAGAPRAARAPARARGSSSASSGSTQPSRARAHHQPAEPRRPGGAARPR